MYSSFMTVLFRALSGGTIMNKERALPFVVGSREKNRQIITLKTNYLVTYNSKKKHNLLSLKIYGAYDYDSTYTKRIGAGVIGDDGRARIAVRVHGECFLDGYELARVLKEKNLPNYAGEYDSEHFLYRVTKNDTELLGDLDFSPGPLGFKFTVDALVPEDKANITNFGMHLKSNYGSKHLASRKTTGAGEATFTTYTQKGTLVKRLNQAAGTEEYEIPIRYDSLKLYTGTTVPSAAYQGFTKVFDIGKPLMSVHTGEEGDIFDEADLVAGTVTRRVGTFIVDSSTQINEAEYYSIGTFAIPLPSDIKSNNMECEFLSYVGNVYDMPDMYDCFCVPEGEGYLYVYFNEEVTSVADARELLLGVEFYYEKVETTEIIDKFESEIPEGFVAIESCNNREGWIEVSYYE